MMKNMILAAAAVAAQDACACLEGDSLPSAEYWELMDLSDGHGEGCGEWELEYLACQGDDVKDECFVQWCYVSPECESATLETALTDEWNGLIAWSVQPCQEEKSAMLYASALVMTAAALAASL